MWLIVVARLAHMVGGIIIAVVLLLVFPVAIILSGGILSAMIGSVMNGALGDQRSSTDVPEASESNSHH